MNPKDLQEYKAKKNGELTPKAAMENVMEAVNRGMVDTVCIVVRTTEGEIKVAHSQANHLTHIGLLHCGIDEIVKDMEGYE
jgi:hypothetical protein